MILDATSHRELPDEHDTLPRQLWSHRPPQIAFGVVLTIFAALLAALVFRGSNRPRVVLMVLFSLTAFLLSLCLTVDKITWATAELLTLTGANIVVVLLLSSDSARRFTRARSSKADGDY